MTVAQGTQQTIRSTDLPDHIRVEQGALLNIFSVIDTADTSLSYTVDVASGGRVRLFTAVVASAQLHSELRLEDEGAVAEQHVLYCANEKDVIDIETNSTHIGRNTMARTIVHGAAFDAATVSFTGNIHIEQTGAHTDAHLEHEGLLLSNKAKINALPGFTINTNDVKAIHSSAVHFVRPEQLFYLQSRGISEAQARMLIVSGFLDAMIASAHDEETAATVHTIINEKIASLS